MIKCLKQHHIILLWIMCAFAPHANGAGTTPTASTKTCNPCCSPLFMPRPQGLNSALYNPFYYDNKRCDKCLGSSYTLGYRFNQTFRGQDITKCLFGKSKLAFIGSQAQTSSPIADKALILQAEDFGLAPYFKGSITFNPRIQNNIIDFTARWELKDLWDCLDGFYVGLNTSLVHTNWSLRSTCKQEWETAPVCVQSNNTMPRCLMSSKEEGAFGSIQEALMGEKSIGDLKGPWRWGRFVFDNAQTKTALANLDLILGYDFFDCTDYHVGVFIRTSAPTGNSPQAKTFFEPIIGNGHHWELGGGLDAHYTYWLCGDQSLQCYITGSINHLFKNSQWRTFDFKDCCMSRYTLLKEFDQVSQYTRLMNGTEFTTRKVESSFAMQGDGTLGLTYKICGWAFGGGYNIYGRSKEKIVRCSNDGRCDLENRNFGKKGKAGVCLYSAANKYPDWRLSATTSTSCISQPSSETVFDNQLAINPWFGTDYQTWDQATEEDVYESGEQAGTAEAPSISLKPFYVFAKDLALKGVPRQITHKVFGHIDYQWSDYEYQPYIGIGGEAEFAQNGDCNSCAASQWGLWIRGGISF